MLRHIALLPSLVAFGTGCHQAGNPPAVEAAANLPPNSVAASATAPASAAASVSASDPVSVPGSASASESVSAPESDSETVAPAAPSGAASLPTAAAAEEPSDQDYQEAVNGPLAQYMRGEAPVARRAPEPTEFICVSTGEFNVAPSGDRLLMETWCAERNPPEGSIRVLQVEDTVAPRIPGKLVFRIAFQDTVVSVQDVGGTSEVRLHYRDKEGTFHHVDLAPRQGEKYSYSFAKLSPDTVVPIGESRTIETER